MMMLMLQTADTLDADLYLVRLTAGGRITMKVKNVYSTERYPRHYVAELMDGSLALFYISPFRPVTRDDMSSLAITSISQIDSDPYILPMYMLKMYGLSIG